MKNRSVKFKFRLGAAVIFLVFSIVVSMVAYFYLKSMVTRDVYKEAKIFISAADATRTYVKDVLRPTIVTLLHEDDFIPQAMSTSFIGREIMERLRQRFPEFNYKRAAANPMNPINQADGFEKEMLKWFTENPEVGEWQGLIKNGQRSYYTRLKAIYAEPECMRCHGDPADAPSALKAIYGTDGGFHYSVGDVVAADTIYIPVDIPFVQVREAALNIFLIAVVSLLALLGFLSLLFNRTVVSELEDLLTTFQNISGDKKPETDALSLESGDEITQLKKGFENVARDLKKAHDELKRSETKYRLIFETSQDAILILDNDTRIRDINVAGIQLFGLQDHKEAHSMETAYQLFWDVRDAKRFFDLVRTNGKVKGLETNMVNKQGEKLDVLVSATTRKDDNHHFAGIDLMLRDITEKRRMERYLAQTEKMAAIGQLSSGVAHEINNPLGVIKCYADLLAKDLAANEGALNDLRIIQKHTEQCKSVVEALLNFARVSETEFVSTDIHTCIEDVLTVVQLQENKIAIEKAFSDNIPAVTVDVQKIRQVLTNLLLNACQAMKGKGKITIRTRMMRKDMLTIEIIDTGPGISEKYIDRIFEPFFSTKGSHKGTGLGLSVSYGIIERHGGKIDVFSRPGKGSRFVISMPVNGNSQRQGRTQ